MFRCSNKQQPTAEQIRIAQITEIGSGIEDPKMREKVASLMDMTQRSEEEVCCALYECDNDLDRAVIFLFEALPVVSFLIIYLQWSLVRLFCSSIRILYKDRQHILLYCIHLTLVVNQNESAMK